MVFPKKSAQTRPGNFWERLIPEDVAPQLVKMVGANPLLIYSWGLILEGLLLFGILGCAPWHVLVIWVGVIFSIRLARFFLMLSKKGKVLGVESARRFLKWMYLTTLLYGASLGFGAWFFKDLEDSVYQLFLAFIVGVINAGAVVNYAPLPRLVGWFSTISLGPYVVMFALSGLPVLYSSSGGLVALIFSMIVFGRMVSARNIKSLRLYKEKDALYQGLQIELSEKHRLEAEGIALKESEGQFRDLLEGTQQGILIHQDLKLLYVNRAFTEMMAYASPEDCLAQAKITDFLQESDIQWMAESYQKRMAGEEVPNLHEINVQARDGSLRRVIIYPKRIQWHGRNAMQVTVFDLTRRYELEQSLKEAENSIQQAEELGQVGFWALDIKTGALEVSRSLSEILEIPRERIQTSIEDLLGALPDDGPERVRKGMAQALAEGVMDPVELRFPRTNQTTTYISVQGRLQKDEEGNPSRLVGILLNTTQLKHTEEEFRQSQARLEGLIRHMPVVVWVLNDEGYITYVDGGGAGVLPDKPEDIIGKHASELQGYHRPEIVEGAGQAFEGKSALVVYDFNGLWFENYFTPLENAEGEIKEVLCVSLEITQRKRAEKRQEEVEKNFRDLVEGTKLGIVIQRDLKPLFANKAVMEMFQLPSTESFFSLESVADVLVPGDKAILEADLAKAKETGKPPPSFYRFHAARPDGSEIVFENYAQPVVWEGEPAVMGTFVDITHQEKLAKQLRQAQKMEAVGQLAGGIAHDFNNLLQVVRGNAELILSSGKADGETRGDLEQILSAVSSAAARTQQLLTFSRHNVLNLALIDCNDLIGRLIEMVSRLLGENILITTELDDSVGKVKGDPSLIQQVLMNLCVNARDAMNDGGSIILRTEKVAVDKAFAKDHSWANKPEYVLLQVSDTGSGISEKDQARIFEPFFSTKDVGKGTGLGLAIVYGIIQQHKGHIMVESEPDSGTLFSMYLPVSHDKSTNLVAEEKPKKVEGGSERILVAEDEEGVLTVLVKLLERKGYQTFSARNGAEAVTLYEKNKDQIDLVILDVVMPKMGGAKAYDKIIKINPSVPVIFSTGYTGDNLESEFLQSNHLPVIQKPYSPGDLFSAIRSALD